MRSTPDNTSRFLIILTNIWNDVIDCNPYGFLAYIAFIHIRTVHHCSYTSQGCIFFENSL